jgi:hypothetical protein
MNYNTINCYAYFRAVASRHEKLDRKRGRLPWWWYLCVAFAWANVLFLLFVCLGGRW